MLRSQNLSYILSHWCRHQVGFASYAVQEVLCIMWFLITYFQDYLVRSLGVLGLYVCYESEFTKQCALNILIFSERDPFLEGKKVFIDWKVWIKIIGFSSQSDDNTSLYRNSF